MGETFFSNLVCVSADGFLLGNDFICKEFSLLDCDSNFLYHTTIKSTKKYSDHSVSEREAILFDTKYSFGLEYDCGDIEMNKFIQHVFPMIKGKKVIVEHLCTANWLKTLFEPYGDIDCSDVGKWFQDFPCMNDKLESVCQYHDSDSICGFRCTLFNVLGLKKGICKVLPHLKDLENTLCIGVAGFDLYNDGFLCKEICLLSLNSAYMYHTTVKPQNKEKTVHNRYMSSIKFETDHINGLPYDCGETTFDEMIQKIRSLIQGKKILVKDYCHLFWLKKMFKLNDFQFIQVGKPYFEIFRADLPDCYYHRVKYGKHLNQWKAHCAMRQAMDLKTDLLNLLEKTMSHQNKE